METQLAGILLPARFGFGDRRPSDPTGLVVGVLLFREAERSLAAPDTASSGGAEEEPERYGPSHPCKEKSVSNPSTDPSTGNGIGSTPPDRAKCDLASQLHQATVSANPRSNVEVTLGVDESPRVSISTKKSESKEMPLFAIGIVLGAALGAMTAVAILDAKARGQMAAAAKGAASAAAAAAK